jgi:small subunit ribosomal protein S20
VPRPFQFEIEGQETMANTPQAKKRIRRNARRAEINGARVSRIRTFVKQVETAIASGDKEQATAAIRRVQPEIARGVSKGVLHKNTAARKISRLSRRVAALT